MLAKHFDSSADAQLCEQEPNFGTERDNNTSVCGLPWPQLTQTEPKGTTDLCKMAALVTARPITGEELCHVTEPVGPQTSAPIGEENTSPLILPGMTGHLSHLSEAPGTAQSVGRGGELM